MKEQNERPSLNQLAIVLGVPATRLQSKSVAYKPVEGAVYDKHNINWENVDAFIARRLEKTGYDSVEAVYEAAVNTVWTPKKSTRTSDPNSVWNKVLFGTTPVRKGNVVAGTIIEEKKTKEQYTVEFATATIVCFEKADEVGNLLTVAVGNRMFNLKYSIVSEVGTNESDI